MIKDNFEGWKFYEKFFAYENHKIILIKLGMRHKKTLMSNAI